ncbi:MAG: PocR ligand-binding domain-containing protein [Intestinibacter bartlettii]
MEKLLTNFSKATGFFIEAVDVYGKTFFTPKDIEMREFCSYIRSNEEAIKSANNRIEKHVRKHLDGKLRIFLDAMQV